MGQGHQALTFTKCLAADYTGCFGIEKAKQLSFDNVRNTRMPGAVRILHISLTVGHLPTQ